MNANQPFRRCAQRSHASARARVRSARNASKNTRSVASNSPRLRIVKVNAPRSPRCPRVAAPRTPRFRRSRCLGRSANGGHVLARAAVDGLARGDDVRHRQPGLQREGAPLVEEPGGYPCDAATRITSPSTRLHGAAAPASSAPSSDDGRQNCGFALRGGDARCQREQRLERSDIRCGLRGGSQGAAAPPER